MNRIIGIRKDVWEMPALTGSSALDPDWMTYRMRYVSSERSREDVLAVLKADIDALAGGGQVFYRVPPSSHSEQSFDTGISYAIATARVILYRGDPPMTHDQVAEMELVFAQPVPVASV